MKKTAALLCALLLVLAAVAACAQPLTMTGLDTETVSRQWENSLFFTRMQELTGVEVSAHAVTEDEEYQKLLGDMAGGKVEADVLFKAALTREQEQALADSGALIDLAPMIEEHMPNLSALLAAHPEWREIISLPDGRIVTLPQINEGERHVLVWINTAWLSQLGLGMPGSVEELTEALQAMKGADLNGNGSADEVPVNLLGTFEMRWLLPYFGVVADDYHLARNEAGEVVFAPELQGYRDFIAQLAEWVRFGVLPQEAFTSSHAAQQLAASSSSGEEKPVVSGLLVSVAPYTKESVRAAADYRALLLPGPDGKIRWRDFLGQIWPGCFAVTSACEDPAAALRWADALYGEAGAILGHAGVEGEDYAFSSEGRWSFVVDDLRTVEDVRRGVLMYTGGTMPGITPYEFLCKVDSDVDVHVLNENEAVREVAERVTLPFCLDAEAQARANELAMTIGRLVEEGIGRFATGEMEMTDENYSAWLASMRKAGSEELAALFVGK